jgi:hypothetical protein
MESSREPRIFQNADHEKYFKHYYPPKKECCSKTLHAAIGDEEGRIKIYNLSRFIDWCNNPENELDSGFNEQREASFLQYGIDQDGLLNKSHEKIPLHVKIKDVLPITKTCEAFDKITPNYQPAREVTHFTKMTNVTHMHMEQALRTERIPILDALRCV